MKTYFIMDKCPDGEIGNATMLRNLSGKFFSVVFRRMIMQNMNAENALVE